MTTAAEPHDTHRQTAGTADGGSGSGTGTADGGDDDDLALPEEVQQYIDGLSGPHRRLFGRIQQLILEELPDARVVLSYGIPLYKVGSRHVGLNGSRAGGVTLTTTSPDHIAVFRRRQPSYKVNKASIQFDLDDTVHLDDLPYDDIRDVVRRAIGR